MYNNFKIRKLNFNMKKFMHITGSVVRTLLALTFLFSGTVKAVDPLGTTYKIEDYLIAFDGFWINFLPWAEPAAIILIAVEFILGFCMLLNVRTQWTSWLSLAFYLVMTPLTLYIAMNNPVSDCGCFGDAIILTNWQTFWKNIILLSLVIILLLCKKQIPPTWMPWMEGVWAGIAILLVGGFMTYNLRHLPIWDFRPFKIGNNIPELMEGEIAPKYDYIYVMKKGEETREFTKDNYPDSTWTFVERKDILIEEGYIPPIHDFYITTMDDEDITEDILYSPDKVTLAIMYDLNKTNRKLIDDLNELAEETMAKGEMFYAVTGSYTQDILDFIEETNAKYAFCSCDGVTLKTIIRANPGIVEIQNGTIINKYNLRDR